MLGFNFDNLINTESVDTTKGSSRKASLKGIHYDHVEDYFGGEYSRALGNESFVNGIC